MRYRSKPVEIEAFRCNGETGEIDVPGWFADYVGTHCNPFMKDKFGEVVVLLESSEGMAIVDPGDYIIRGENGELSSCKPDLFERAYEII